MVWLSKFSSFYWSRRWLCHSLAYARISNKTNLHSVFLSSFIACLIRVNWKRVSFGLLAVRSMIIQFTLGENKCCGVSATFVQSWSNGLRNAENICPSFGLAMKKSGESLSELVMMWTQDLFTEECKEPIEFIILFQSEMPAKWLTGVPRAHSSYKWT